MTPRPVLVAALVIAVPASAKTPDELTPAVETLWLWQLWQYSWSIAAWLAAALVAPAISAARPAVTNEIDSAERIIAARRRQRRDDAARRVFTAASLLAPPPLLVFCRSLAATRRNARDG